jgi:sugar phosphate permease
MERLSGRHRPFYNPGMRRHERWLALALVTVTQVVVSLVNQGVPTLAAFIQADLGLSRPQVGMVGTGFYLGGLAAMALVGWAVDRFGERVVLGVGALLVGLAVGGVLAVHALAPLLGVLVLAGVGAATATPAGTKAVMGWFAPRERGLAMGLRQTGIPVGGALAALLLPALAARHGWRTALAAAGAASAAGGLLTVWLYRDPAPGGVDPPPAGPQAREAAAGWRQTLTPALLRVSLAGILLPIGQFALVTYLTLYLRDVWHIPVLVGASFLLLAQLAGTAGRVVWGLASDHVFGGRRRDTLLWIAGSSAVAAVALAALPARLPPLLLAAAVGVFGFTAQAWQGIYMTLVAEMAGRERAGAAVGISLTTVQIGITAGTPLFGALAQAAGSYRPAWLADAGAFVLAWSLLLRLREAPTPVPAQTIVAAGSPGHHA